MKISFSPSITSARSGRCVAVQGGRGHFGGAGRPMFNGNPGSGGATP